MGSLALNEVHQLDGSLVLTASGIVDDATVECFERGLDRAMGAGSRQLIVDLTTCRLDSAGLAALVRFRRRSGSRSAATSLVASDGAPFRMLEIIGLTSQFSTHPTIEAALSSSPAAPSLVARRRGTLALRSRPSRHASTPGDCRVWPRRTPPSTSLDGAVLPLRAIQ